MINKKERGGRIWMSSGVQVKSFLVKMNLLSVTARKPSWRARYVLWIHVLKVLLIDISSHFFLLINTFIVASYWLRCEDSEQQFNENQYW